jgi:hypothetical protein
MEVRVLPPEYGGLFAGDNGYGVDTASIPEADCSVG